MKRLAIIASAAVALLTSAPAFAQTPGGSGAPSASAMRAQAQQQQSMMNSRTQNQLERERGGRRGRDQRPDGDPKVAAQTLATAAGLPCQVTEAVWVGKTDDRKDLYEAACATGPGYLLQSTTPPTAYDCLLLADTAERQRVDGVEAAAGSVCTLPANQNSLAVIAGYAREAGVPCQIDAGKIAGATTEGGTVYEVGCPNADGYRLERTGATWKVSECLEVVAAGSTCAFTTPEEQVAGFRPLLAGTDIDDCDAQQIRLMGQNDNGRFVEVKCASGEGYVTRVKDKAVAQVYACAVATRIGGGCTLTPVAAATSEQQ